MILVQTDANAKIGNSYISKDPNVVSSNGKLLIGMVERQELVVANSLEECEGTITRHRLVDGKLEQSILDYLIICQRLRQMLTEMKIDEKREFPLTRYGKKNGLISTQSDHNWITAKFSLEIPAAKKSKDAEIFNFRDDESRLRFVNEMENNNSLSMCFENEDDFETSAKRFFKTLNRKFHKCFTKIRIANKNKREQKGNPIIQQLLKKKRKITQEMKKSDEESMREKYMKLLEENERIINEKFSKMNKEKVEKYIEETETSDGMFSQPKLWKLKKKLLPQVQDPPMAKFDGQGNLVTSHQNLKKLYLQTYVDRLTHKVVHTKFLNIFSLKEDLWFLRYKCL